MRRVYKLWFIILLFVIGCETPGVVIKGAPASINDAKKAILKIIGEPKEKSENGRDFISQYMDKKGRIVDSAKFSKERRRVVVSILGERRPYDIVVNVEIEAMISPNVYEKVGDDQGLAGFYSRLIKAELLKSLENRNIIDDFKPF